MRKFKQFVALMVTIATIASLLTFSATTVTAEESFPQITITADDLLLIEKLEALGVITANDVASSYVTRRQMAEIIKKYMGLPEGSTGSDEKQFNDVKPDDVSFGAISTLRDLEVITGDENNNFRPDDYLNYNEAVVFVINAVGHKYFALREGGYPTGYMRVAIKHDMLDKISMTNGESFIPLIDVYKMLESALSAATIIPQYYGDGNVRYTISGTDTFLSETYGINKYRGKVTGNELTSLSTTNLKIDKQQIEIDEVIYDTPGYYYDYFLGYTVDYYVRETAYGKELMYVEETPRKNSTIKIDSDDILMNKVTSTRITYITNDGENEDYIDLEEIVDVIYNGQWYSGYGALSNVMPHNGYIEALDNDNDGASEVLFIYDYEVEVVASVDNYEEKINFASGNTPLELSEDVYKVNIISAKEKVSLPFDGIKKGDVLNIAKSYGNNMVITIYVSMEKVTGKITGKSDELGYEINDEYYETTYNCEEFEIGTSGAFLLDMNGKIAAYEYSSEGDATMFAAMAGVDYNSQSAINPDVKVKLFTSNGMFVTASLTKNVKINNTRYDVTKIGGERDAYAALEALCGAPQTGEEYVLHDSYVVKYTLTSDGQISYIDTGMGGIGNLNPFADHYLYCASRQGPMLMMTPTTDMATWETDAIYTRLASGAVVFITPKAGELSDETGYGLLESWMVDYCYANIDANSTAYTIFGGRTKVIDNFTAYHTGADEIPVAQVILLRGGSAGTAVSGSSKMYIVTNITDSANEEGMMTKTLYEENNKLGQLAETVTFRVQNQEMGPYSIEQIKQNNILSTMMKDGTIIRYGTNEKGYINQISIIAEYNSNTGNIVPKFTSADASNQYINNTRPVSASGSNTAVVTVNRIDNKNNLIDFNAGSLNLVCDMKYASIIKIWDSEENSVREASAADIVSNDQCALRLDVNFRVMEIIILR